MANIFHNICNNVALGILSAIDRTILTHFIRVCCVLVGRILTFDLIEEAAERLIKIIKLIEKHYGRDKIILYLHLSLHLQECSYNFSPLYTFWCFSFEHMNGILGNCNLFFLPTYDNYDNEMC